MSSRNRNVPAKQKGMSFAEVLVTLAILGILILASYTLTSGSQQLTKINMDRQFATQKAISIMEELRSVAQAAVGPAAIVLDQYDDGTNTPNLLTIQLAPTDNPAHKLSGNFQMPDGSWLYSRRISVQRIGGQSTAGVRLVRVTILKNEGNTQRPLAEVASIIRTLANVAAPTQVYDVYAIAIKNVPGWWVYTANLVPFVQNAVNELQARNPGLNFRVHWITKLSYGRDEEYRPYVNRNTASTADIDWAYFYPGTLPQNDAVRNPPNLSEYYPTGGFESRIKIDGVNLNEYDVNTNPLPFALADQYNHAKRYPEERAMYDARVAAINPSTSKRAYPNEEPTYRLLLDDMILRPNEYTNAILINLHGELFPFPPVRNYSDPAKSPDPTVTPYNLQFLRVVTHPEKLAYNTTADPPPAGKESNNIKLRVYSYEAWKGAVSSTQLPNILANSGSTKATNNPRWLPVPIAVVLRGVSMAGNIQVDRIEGGTEQTALPVAVTYTRSNALVAPDGYRMYATVTDVGPDTLIKLYNSPFETPPCTVALCGAADTRGLNQTYSLYNMDYIPEPVEDLSSPTDCASATPFSVDLTDTNATAGADCGYYSNTGGPKNTARWVITIPAAALNAELTSLSQPTNMLFAVETSMGEVPAMNLPTTGRLAPVRDEPQNISRTYVWRGTDTWLYGDGTEANPPNLPMTERFQFIGDPRHCPYSDMKKRYVANSATNEFVQSRIGDSYNRYFDDFHDAGGNRNSDWPGLELVNNDTSTTNDGWVGPGGSIELDVNRGFQLLRTALTSSRSIYTTMTGYSYYYIGIGGEIGYDAANLFPNSIPISQKPYTGVGAAIYEQSIINDDNISQGSGVKYVRENAAPALSTDYWWSMNWLGELFPDDQYATGTSSNYAVNGNLRTGSNANNGAGTGNFRRVLRAFIAPTTHNILPRGTVYPGGLNGSGNGDNAVRRTGPPGSTSFFWTGTSTSTFHHTPNSSNADIVNEGAYISSTTTGYNFPLLNPIPNNRPFNINVNATGDNPPGFLESRYGGTFISNEDARYYRNAGTTGPGSSLISLRNPNTNRVAFIVVNGLSPVGDSGTAFIARWSFLSLIHSYMEAGLYTDANPTPVGCTGCPFRVGQLPRVNIINPNAQSLIVDPAAINIQWGTTWRRWDDKAYTPGYPNGFTETVPMTYQVMYSDDNGVTWKWVQNDAKADPGVKLPNGDGKIISGTTSYLWSVPEAQFPQGNYVIRVEGYRTGYSLHYSYHQFTAFIRRAV
jgi:prepilin-type N-terminal cleavage/methylation domain-containing protein